MTAHHSSALADVATQLSKSQSRKLRRKGRPAQGGRKPGWVLSRSVIILQAYEQARCDGANYLRAIECAQSAVKRYFPTMRVSSTEVKRCLHEFQSSERDSRLCVELIPGPVYGPFGHVIGNVQFVLKVSHARIPRRSRKVRP